MSANQRMSGRVPGWVLSLLLGVSAPLWAQNTDALHILSSRLDHAGQAVKVPLVLEVSQPAPKAVLLILPSLDKSLEVTLPSA